MTQPIESAVAMLERLKVGDFIGCGCCASGTAPTEAEVDAALDGVKQLEADVRQARADVAELLAYCDKAKSALGDRQISGERLEDSIRKLLSEIESLEGQRDTYERLFEMASAGGQ